jgi:hypothetical protein
MIEKLLLQFCYTVVHLELKRFHKLLGERGWVGGCPLVSATVYKIHLRLKNSRPKNYENLKRSAAPHTFYI